MSLPIAVIIAILVSFLLGSIPFGVIVGRVGFGKDPRDGGSGSIGMTNMARQFGARAAAVTFVGDVAKGALAICLIRLVLMPQLAMSAAWQGELLFVLGVFAAIAGHVFCPWLGFKGGKGISTGFGAYCVAFPPIGAGILAVFLVLALSTKRISAGSICAAISLPIFACVFYWGSVPVFVANLLIAIVVVYAHRSNVKRLIAGEEPAFTFGHSSKDEPAAKGESSDE